MASLTALLGLRKPAGSDLVNVTTDISENMDKLDAASNKVLGVASVTTIQSAIVDETDITGLSLTVTVGANRRLRLWTSLAIGGTQTGQVAQVRIREGTTQLQGRIFDLGAGTGYGFMVEVIITPTAGEHTYRVTLTRQSGGASVTSLGQSINPQQFMVEDIGAV